MDKVKHQSNTSSVAHRSMQRSETLNRRYVKRPSVTPDNSVAVNVAQKVTVKPRQYAQKTTMQKKPEIGIVAKAKPMAPAKKHQLQQIASERTAARRASMAQRPQSPTLSAKERKDRAIEQAMVLAANMDSDSNQNSSKKSQKQLKAQKRANQSMQTSSGAKRFALAFACAAVCVGILAVFINMNMPDISVRVAAIQTGIEAVYPSYVPRDYSLSNIVSEEGKITMEFNGPDSAKFTLTEEKTSWDSTALLNNFVKKEWGNDYTTTHEQGITIYINGSDATWVNGGILFSIDASANNLTKKQINSIVTSL